MIYTIRIDPERARGHHIFRLAGWPLALIVSGLLKNALADIADLGVQFESVVEHSQNPPAVADSKATADDATSRPFQRDYALVACWPPQQEAIEVCAERLLYLFNQFGYCDGGLAQWYETQGGQPDAPATPIDVESKDAVIELLERGRTQHESSDSNSDAGFHVHLRNCAEQGPAVDLTIACGSDLPRHVNRVVMRFPSGMTGLATLERMQPVVASVVRAWDPEWAGVYPSELADAEILVPEEPLLDWILYLCRRRCRRGTTLHYPGDICGLKSGTLGAIFSSQPEPTDPANPQHQQNIDRARQAMGL